LLADKPTISHLSWRSISVEVETVLAVVFIVEVLIVVSLSLTWRIANIGHYASALIEKSINIPLEFGQVI